MRGIGAACARSGEESRDRTGSLVETLGHVDGVAAQGGRFGGQGVVLAASAADPARVVCFVRLLLVPEAARLRHHSAYILSSLLLLLLLQLLACLLACLPALPSSLTTS